MAHVAPTLRDPCSLRRLTADLIRDERGFVISIELVLIVTILVIGLIAGLTALRDAVVSELVDVARGVQQINQSYSVNGSQSPSAASAGSAFADATDAPSTVAGGDQCIIVFGSADEL